MPQVAAWHICGRGPHPLLTRDVRQTQARGSQTGERPCHGRVSPVCRLRSEDRAVPMSRVFGQHWAVCGAAAVRDSYDSMILDIQSIRFQKKNASGSPVSGPLRAFDFRTRIKGGGRKRPPPGHKAPQCGAFPAFEEGAPFHHSRRFQVVGDLRNPVFPTNSGLFDRR